MKPLMDALLSSTMPPPWIFSLKTLRYIFSNFHFHLKQSNALYNKFIQICSKLHTFCLLQNEVIKPTIDGVLNIMRSCLKAKSLQKMVFTSSAGAVTMQEHLKPVYDEDCWTDVDFCRKKKMTAWVSTKLLNNLNKEGTKLSKQKNFILQMYFVSKTLAEKAAIEFAEQNGLNLVSVIPTLVNGQFIMNSMPPSMLTALALITSMCQSIITSSMAIIEIHIPLQLWNSEILANKLMRIDLLRMMQMFCRKCTTLLDLESNTVCALG